MADYAIVTEGLSRSFAQVQAVDNLSLAIPKGSIFGFLGANGAGKTTTVHLLLGLLEPTAGNAHVLDFDVRTQAASIRERTGTLLEFNGLYERLSAEDNLELYGRIYRMRSAERKARVKELLAHFELWDRRRDQIGTWSRGMKQKLALARTLLHRPELVFLDEPTAGLDPMAATTLNNDLAQLVKQENMTVFLNTHNLADAEKYCDQVGVIRRGKLIAEGNPDQLRLNLSGTQVEIFGSGFTDELLAQLQRHPGIRGAEKRRNRLIANMDTHNEIAPLVNLIVAQGGTVEEIRREHGSLQDAFITLMEEA